MVNVGFYIPDISDMVLVPSAADTHYLLVITVQNQQECQVEVGFEPKMAVLKLTFYINSYIIDILTAFVIYNKGTKALHRWTRLDLLLTLHLYACEYTLMNSWLTGILCTVQVSKPFHVTFLIGPV